MLISKERSVSHRLSGGPPTILFQPEIKIMGSFLLILILILKVFNTLDRIIVYEALLSLHVIFDEQVRLLIEPLTERPGAATIHRGVHYLLAQIVLEKLQFTSCIVVLLALGLWFLVDVNISLGLYRFF
jgi:hypothetical protein